MNESLNGDSVKMEMDGGFSTVLTDPGTEEERASAFYRSQENAQGNGQEGGSVTSHKDLFPEFTLPRILSEFDEDLRMTRFTYEDPYLSGYSVNHVQTSVIDDGASVMTAVARFPREVLAEFNTHRVFGRNSASSRARSVRSTIEQVMEEPMVPLFTRNQRGMSGKFLTETQQIEATEHWLKARDRAVASALSLLTSREVSVDEVNDWSSILDTYYDDMYAPDGDYEGKEALSVHKQDANRLLEPFMWHEVVVTSSFWDNFFDLRIEKNAKFSIAAIAVLLEAAWKSCRAVETHLHAPFVKNSTVSDRWLHLFTKDKCVEMMMTSAGHAAQVSYVSVVDGRLADPIKVAKSLARDKHMSPFEHVAYSKVFAERMDLPFDSKNLTESWGQFRTALELGVFDIEN